MAEQFKDRLTGMIAEWIRVGFCQGNFNADNCLVGGRTMDYGPFGSRCCCYDDADEAAPVFMLTMMGAPATIPDSLTHIIFVFSGFVDAYDPEWCSWTGGAPHFSFMSQFDAGRANFNVFARNLLPLLDDQGAKQLKEIQASFPEAGALQLKQAMAAKLGVAHTHANFNEIMQK